MCGPNPTIANIIEAKLSTTSQLFSTHFKHISKQFKTCVKQCLNTVENYFETSQKVSTSYQNATGFKQRFKHGPTRFKRKIEHLSNSFKHVSHISQKHFEQTQTVSTPFNALSMRFKLGFKHV